VSENVVTIVLRIVLDGPDGPSVTVTDAPRRQRRTGTAAQRAERAERVGWMLRAEPDLTGAQVAGRLGVSVSSGKRYLADARKANGS